MSTPALRVENVSKMYRLGEVGTGSLSHDLNRAWARLRGRPDPYALVGAVNDRASEGTRDFVWALRDINFEVGQGDIVGIIGRNGAGKSTLLKLLSRVTAPTEGSIYINGRIASLLEVGTGFHPDLTGRENIFLNGAILGMSKQEIRSRFDEIVEFSGCAKYIDTPVKRYSSGMHVRLAFAVAAHLETDILIVDEVLAVGDAEFQQKCLGKMKDLSTKGHRTVLFVSHNMAAVRQLCPRSILMNQGTVVNSGETNAIIEQYMTLGSTAARIVTWPKEQAPGSEGVSLRGIYVKNHLGQTEGALGSDEDILVEVDYELDAPRGDLRVGISLFNSEGTLILISSDYEAGGSGAIRPEGRHSSTVRIPGHMLLDGKYTVGVGIETPRIQDFVSGETCAFEIDEMVHDGWGPKHAVRMPGVIHPSLEWTASQASE
ncbi:MULTISPECIES: ABC transporter ATP-binding protein [unclassified Minwuia]|uniref:ABC transporter ATP-binding protein n=1 Tax=unclassified Minwuia TaxID=2618799 RepID=UPI00247AD0F6|nr:MULTISPECIES: ABC transporter ATP-binding protein [unclassified Minwuia]